jgi:hypothetical protein
LRHIRSLELASLERVRGDDVRVLRALQVDIGDEDFVELDLQVRERRAACLYGVAFDLGDVIALRTLVEQRRICLVDLYGGLQVMERRLAGAAATPPIQRVRLGGTPAERLDIDPIGRTDDSAAARLDVLIAKKQAFYFAACFSPLADGNFETSRRDTVNPSSW